MRAVYEEATLGELFSQLGDQASSLVREEVELAKTEMASTAKRAGKGAALVAAGAAVGFAALLALIASFIILLALVVKLWIAALVITGVVAAAALLLITLGLDAVKRREMAPKHTLQTLREDVEWAKTQTR